MNVLVDLVEVLRRHEHRLRCMSGVLNVGVGTKWTGGKDTGVRAIVVMVRDKVPKERLAAKDVVPSELDGVAVDVVELKTADFEVAHTTPSSKTLEVQRRIAGGVREK